MTEAVMLTTQNNSFGPTEISYLENLFCNLAKNAKRFEVKNGNDPTPGNITGEKESEMEEFVEYACLTIGMLGYKVFLSYTESKKTVVEETKEETMLYMKRKNRNGIIHNEAMCKLTSEGFVLLEGSKIEKTESKAIPTKIKKLRRLANIDDDGIDRSQTRLPGNQKQ